MDQCFSPSLSPSLPSSLKKYIYIYPGHDIYKSQISCPAQSLLLHCLNILFDNKKFFILTQYNWPIISFIVSAFHGGYISKPRISSTDNQEGKILSRLPSQRHCLMLIHKQADWIHGKTTSRLEQHSIGQVYCPQVAVR